MKMNIVDCSNKSYSDLLRRIYHSSQMQGNQKESKKEVDASLSTNLKGIQRETAKSEKLNLSVPPKAQPLNEINPKAMDCLERIFKEISLK